MVIAKIIERGIMKVDIKPMVQIKTGNLPTLKIGMNYVRHISKKKKL